MYDPAGLPLWFHEGLAVLGERTWGLEDQARLVSEMVMVSRTPLDRVDAMFAADEGSKTRAYTLAAAFVRELIRRHGISRETFYKWRRKYGGLKVDEAKRLRALEEENHRLKRVVADQVLNIQVLKDLLGKP